MRFLLFFILATNIACSQNKATIKFVNLKLLEGRNLYFKINGETIKANDSIYSVTVNSKKILDTIVYSYDRDFKDKWLSFVKFRKKRVYIIKINPCGVYELFSEKKQKKGKIKLLKSKKDENRIISFSSDLVEISLIRENINKFFEYHSSGNCPYSYQTVLLKKGDTILDSCNFHFLHGERLKIELVNDKIKFKL